MQNILRQLYLKYIKFNAGALLNKIPLAPFTNMD